jgi:hypothetical protein
LSHDPARYPPDWPAISARIKERDGFRCAFCGAPDRGVGYFDDSGAFVEVAPAGDADIRRAIVEERSRKVITIVLSCVHVHDKNPMSCEDSNLAACCQRCHLRLDQGDHLVAASRTRAAKAGAGTLALFGEDEVGGAVADRKWGGK